MQSMKDNALSQIVSEKLQKVKPTLKILLFLFFWPIPEMHQSSPINTLNSQKAAVICLVRSTIIQTLNLIKCFEQF